MGLRYYQFCERCVIVLYIMSEGDEQKALDKEEFFRQCNEFKIFEMTDEEFVKFKHERVSMKGVRKLFG